MTALDATFGAMYIGQTVSILVYGATLLQYWTYLQTSQGDSFVLKAVVALLMILGTAIAALTTAGHYRLLVSDIGNPAALAAFPIEFSIEPYFSASSIFFVQMFYAWRLHKLRRPIILSVLVAFLAVTQLFTSSAAETYRMRGPASRQDITKTLTAVSLAADIACDAVITSTMVHFLQQSRTGIKSTESVMTILTTYSLASGAATFILASIILIFFYASPTTLIFLGFSFVLAHVFTNCFLALLNAREVLRNRSGVAANKPSKSTSFPMMRSGVATDTVGDFRYPTTNIKITTENEEFGSVDVFGQGDYKSGLAMA